MDIINIYIALYLHYSYPCHYASPPIKTSTCSSMCNCGSTYSTVTPLTLLPIASTLGGATIAAAGMEYIGAYLAIAVFIYVDIIRKRVTDIVKDV